MAKQILHGEDSRQAILRGVEQAGGCGQGDARTQAGRNVVIEKKFGSPTTLRMA